MTRLGHLFGPVGDTGSRRRGRRDPVSYPGGTVECMSERFGCRRASDARPGEARA